MIKGQQVQLQTNKIFLCAVFFNMAYDAQWLLNWQRWSLRPDEKSNVSEDDVIIEQYRQDSEEDSDDKNCAITSYYTAR